MVKTLNTYALIALCVADAINTVAVEGVVNADKMFSKVYDKH